MPPASPVAALVSAVAIGTPVRIHTAEVAGSTPPATTPAPTTDVVLSQQPPTTPVQCARDADLGAMDTPVVATPISRDSMMDKFFVNAESLMLLAKYGMCKRPLIAVLASIYTDSVHVQLAGSPVIHTAPTRTCSLKTA